MSFLNPKYPTVIYITLIIALLVIFFNVTNIIEKNKETIQKNNFKRFEKYVWENQPENQKEKSSTITGLVLSEKTPSSINKFPLLSLIRYYALVLSLITGIIVITITMFSQRSRTIRLFKIFSRIPS